MNSTLSSVKWVFSTSVLKKVFTFLLFLYIIRHFSRADLGVYREFVLVLSLSSMIALFGFKYIIIVEKQRENFKYGVQFLLLTGLFLSLILFFLRDILAVKYNSPDLLIYIKYGFWLVLTESFYTLIRSVHQLNMNFKLLSIAETINTIFYVVLSFSFFYFGLSFHYFVLSFYLGVLLEIAIMCYPERHLVIVSIINSVRFKYFQGLKKLIQKSYGFMFFSMAPSLFDFFGANLPIILLGLFFSPSYMGNYYIASQFVYTPITLMTYSLASVFLPTFSRTDFSLLPNKIFSFIKHIILIMWIPLIIIGILIKMFSVYLLGEHDIHLVNSIVSALTLRILFTMIFNPLSSIPTVLKKPHYEFVWTIITIPLICIVLYYFRHLEFITLIYINVSLAIIRQISFLIMVSKMVKMSISKLFYRILQGFLIVFPLIICLIKINTFNVYNTIYLIIATIISVCIAMLLERKFLLSFVKKLF
jgi:O-antigen/teichoic acid export membrane protein